MAVKTCRLCQQELPEEDFYLCKRKYKSGYRYYRYYACRPCHSALNLKNWRTNHVPSYKHANWHKAVRKRQIRKYQRLYMRRYRKLTPKGYTVKQIRPLGFKESIMPSPINWEEASKESQQRILARHQPS